MRTSGSRYWYLGFTFLMAAGTVAALAFVNRRYFFHTPLYEFADLAANSLEVLQAKKFKLYYGAYSRWGFHHPGPALFYLFALGEWVFWQTLHWVPTPLNAQVLIVLIVTASFLASGIGAAARWVRSPVFIPLALLLAALHFSSVRLDYCMFYPWPPFVMPMPFFCLVVAAATVATGQGEDLPLLALTGCFIIHSHVAHPLFVLPLFAVAYAGLWRSARRPAAPGAPGVNRPAPPWRRYPRAHRLATAVAALFVLPILIDLCAGGRSNLALILHHLRTHQGDRHPYVDALTYVVKFGAYKPPVSVLSSDYREVGRYLLAHPEMFGLWLAALLAPLAALLLRRWLAPASGAAAAPTEADLRLAGRWRFLGWLAFCFALTAGLTLFWAHIQDGEMLYYNAWFNHGIYFVLALIGAVAAADILETLLARAPRPRLFQAAAALLCLALVGLTYRVRPDHFVATVSDNPACRAVASTFFAALAEHPDAPKMKFLDVPNSLALGGGPALAILLKRHGYDFRVRPEWKTMFAYENALPDDYPASLVAAENRSPMDFWRLVSVDTAPEAAAKRPLMDKFALEIGSAPLDPARPFAITLFGPQYNGDRFCMSGFAPPAPDGLYTLAVDRLAVIHFAPARVPADAAVEVSLDFFAPLANARHPVQRLNIAFDGTRLGSFTTRADAPLPDLRVTIPAALWNAAPPTAFLTLEYPDAVAPKDIDPASQDTRLIAFAARTITFRAVPAAGGGL